VKIVLTNGGVSGTSFEVTKNGTHLDTVAVAAGGQVTNLKLAPLALTGLSVSAQSKQPEAAKAFLDYLKTPEATVVFRAKGVTPG